jgi:hypothetical protein
MEKAIAATLRTLAIGERRLLATLTDITASNRLHPDFMDKLLDVLSSA